MKICILPVKARSDRKVKAADSKKKGHDSNLVRRERRRTLGYFLTSTNHGEMGQGSFETASYRTQCSSSRTMRVKASIFCGASEQGMERRNVPSLLDACRVGEGRGGQLKEKARAWRGSSGLLFDFNPTRWRVREGTQSRRRGRLSVSRASQRCCTH